MTMIRGNDFTTGGAPDKVTKFRGYLKDLKTTGLPLNFSKKGVLNLAARFQMTAEEVKNEINRIGKGGLAG
jgi:hypothetical protein